MSFDKITSGVLIAACASYGAGIGLNLMCHLWGKLRLKVKRDVSNEEEVQRSNLLTGVRMLKYVAPLLLAIMQLREVGYYNQIDTGLTVPVWFWVTLTLTLPILAFDMFYETWCHMPTCIVGAALLGTSLLMVTLSLLESGLLLTFGIMGLAAFLIFGLAVVSAFTAIYRRVKDETITKKQAARCKVLLILASSFISFYAVPYILGPGFTAKMDNNKVFIFYLCLDVVTKAGYDLLAWFFFDLPSFKLNVAQKLV